MPMALECEVWTGNSPEMSPNPLCLLKCIPSLSLSLSLFLYWFFVIRWQRRGGRFWCCLVCRLRWGACEE